jgi:hypothetical protein
MKKITIVSETKIGSPFIAKFSSEAEMQSWLDSCLSKNKFGLPERPELDAEGNPTGNILPAEFQVSIEDISAQVEQEKINAEALEFLAKTDFKVLRHLRDKTLGKQPKMSEEEYLALESQRDQAAAKIVR